MEPLPRSRGQEKTLTLTNIGSAPLILESKIGGALLPAVVAGSELDPGESTTILTYLDPRTMPARLGPMARQLYLYSNDPLVPVVRIAVVATIVEGPHPMPTATPR